MNRVSNYDKFPTIEIHKRDGFATSGIDNILSEIKTKIIKDDFILTLDIYPGVYEDEVIDLLLTKLNPSLIIKSEDGTKDIQEINKMISRNLTDDRVFGVLTCQNLDEFFDYGKIEVLRKTLDNTKGLKVVIGVGASLISTGDLLIYGDLARWEIQLRYRKGMSNWMCDNYKEDTLRKYKRGFFIEWRIADKHKMDIFDSIEYFLDTTSKEYKLMSGDTLRAGLTETTNRPFRVMPFFDPGVWGGQWMKEVCDLDKTEKNFAWCFDCVPEENSLLLSYNGVRIEIPSIDLVLKHPVELLGDKVHARFGAEFPIRFDFLDTMDGQNLSCQVHPLTEYIQKTFGMHYTQDESYYILDAKEGSCVYLGVKTGTKKEELIPALEKAQETAEFDDTKYINCFPAKKHDHFLIPAGTIHCSGKNTMVLEISATPYIFTFKLWDWNRLGLDGRPRPVHINHGKHNIQFYRDTEWVKKNLINRIEKISENDGCTEERTGLHEREFIETRRHWFDKPIEIDTNNEVQVLNLVEGNSAVIESVGNSFEPFEVHYAETFIIPANIKRFRIIPENGKQTGVIRAYVRV